MMHCNDWVCASGDFNVCDIGLLTVPYLVTYPYMSCLYLQFFFVLFLLLLRLLLLFLNLIVQVFCYGIIM